MIISGDWDEKTFPIEKHSKIKICERHFSKGLSWKKAGAYKAMKKLIEEKGSFDDCISKKEIKQRYKSIDKLYKKVKSEQRLKPREEILPKNHREYGGILVHINRNGEPIFSGSGCHRLSIARALNLKKIPCEIGVIHPKALQSDAYKKLITKN
ncbi:MAG: hypothetical protein ACRBCI_08370 [Cellvibrionaceae bacterium]